jgi:Tol biopolymer transport system component
MWRRAWVGAGVFWLVAGLSMPLQAQTPQGVIAVRSAEGLITLDVSSGDQQVVVNGDIHEFDLLPDGTRLTFSDVLSGSAESIFVVDQDGSDKRTLTTFRDPVSQQIQTLIASPNGDLLATDPSPMQGDGVSDFPDIYLVAVSDGSITRVTFGRRDGRWSSPVAWSPDGSQLLYKVTTEGDGPGRQALKVMDADGSNKRTITKNYQFTSAAFTPSGRRIVYTAGRSYLTDGDDDLYSIRLDGRGRRRLTDTPRWDERDLAVGSQGTFALGRSQLTRANDLLYRILVGTVADGFRRMNEKECDEHPDFSADESAISFLRGCGGRARLMIRESDGTERALLENPYSAGIWQPIPVSP